MRLHQGFHTQRAGTLQQGHEHVLFKRRNDQEHEISAVSTRLVNLIGRHDEVLAKDRNVNGCAYRIKIGERTVKATLLSEHRNDRGSPSLVR